LDISADAPAANGLRQSGPGFFASKWKEIKLIGWFFGLLLSSFFVLGMIVKFNSTPWPEVIVSGIDALIVFAFVGFRYRDILPLLKWPEFSMRSVIELAVLSLSFIVLLNVYFTFIEWAGVPMARVAGTYQNAGWHVGSMFLLVSIMPAFVEELAFRGVIQSTLEKVFKEREAWLIQAALFSVLHISPIIFPSHFLMGLCFGYMRLRTKSLYPGMALHAAWNAFVLGKELHWL
jgi:membrane protease YdiL (CAAX protease family)